MKTKQSATPKAGLVLYTHSVESKGKPIDPDKVASYDWNESRNFDPKNYKPKQFDALGDFRIQGQRGRFQVWQVRVDPMLTANSTGRIYVAQYDPTAGAEA